MEPGAGQGQGDWERARTQAAALLTGARRPGSCPPTHPSAPEPLRQCQVPSKCPIQGPDSICPTEPASLPSKVMSPTGLIQVIKSAWRQSRGFRLSLRVPGLPHLPRKPNPLHLTRTCACAYTHTGTGQARMYMTIHHAHTTHTLSPLTASQKPNRLSTKTLESTRHELVCPNSHEELRPRRNQTEP